MCALIKFQNRAVPVIVDGVLKYSPGVRLGYGDFNLISHQGQILYYDTREEAMDYFD